MIDKTEVAITKQLIPFSQRVKQSIPVLLTLWLLLTVLAPHQDTYKAFYYLIMVPAGIIIFFSGRADFNWKDPFLLTALAFFTYAGITTFFVGRGPDETHLRAFRWSVEISLGLVLLFLWMPVVVRNPRQWGHIFLLIALTGATAAIIFHSFNINDDPLNRLTGLGVENPVQISSILLIYFSIGQFLLNRYSAHLSWQTMTLVLTAFIAVCLAILLSTSRTPLAATLVYAVFIGLMMLFARRPREALYVFLLSVLSIALLLILLQYIYGLENFIDKLLFRGFAFRLDIWKGYLFYTPPDSWLLGFGAGTDAQFHPATEAYWKPINIPSYHPHNLILGTWVDTGIVGLVFLSILLYMLIRVTVKRISNIEEKVRLLGILGLVLVLTTTSSQTIISSIKAIWMFFWIPVAFIWFWCKQGSNSTLLEKGGKALD